MKLRKIAFTNNPILGNLELDFTDDFRNTIDTIIIAGENGVGKSYLLSAIYDLSQWTVRNYRQGEKRQYEVEFSEEEIDVLRNDPAAKQLFITNSNVNIFIITYDFNILSDWRQITIFSKLPSSKFEQFPGRILQSPNASKAIKIIFSDVEINFTPKEIDTVTSKNIDTNSTNCEKSNANLATDITQLLIDVQSADALEFTEWARKNTGELVSEDKIDIRTKRFTRAFDFMFPSKKYLRIENIKNKKKIIFEENGKEMDIANLSSGEKQIVFRGSFLLKNKQSSKGALILIDEPEISLHPSWQLKVLNFFKQLFTDENGTQTSQIIISTHSPFIIHNSNRKDDKVIVLKKDENGKPFVLTDPEFFSWSSEQIVKEAFNISTLPTKTPIIFLEGETDEKYFNVAQQYLTNPALINFKWIGRINEKGNAENTGDTALNQAKTFFLANPQEVKNKIVLLYDNDTNKPEEDFEDLFIRRMRKNNENTTYKIGVENLLKIDFDVQRFYKENIQTDNYGAKSTICKLDKTALCNYICNDLDKKTQKEILKNVINEIKRISLECMNLSTNTPAS
jgi:predicted ATPase